jgi:hypothetical protein
VSFGLLQNGLDQLIFAFASQLNAHTLGCKGKLLFRFLLKIGGSDQGQAPLAGCRRSGILRNVGGARIAFATLPEL